MIQNLDEIKARADIVEVIESFLELRKSGANFVCTCPFHAEKSASFVVSPSRQIWHCFGCGEGGDALKFIQKYERLDFVESVKKLADICKVEVVQSSAKNELFSKRKEAYSLLERLNEIFIKNLKQNEQLKNYLFKRGLNEDDFTSFGVGLALSNENLIKILQNDLSLALELGLIKHTKNGLYSFLAEKIIFSIKDFSGRVVGFSARIHPYKNFINQAKYINSSESFMFKKSNLLYNFHKIKSSLNQNNELIICEGFFDSIALIKNGFNAVASLGTAFNETHLSLILKHAPSAKIKLCFDNDHAGLNATLKALELLHKNHIFNASVALILNENKKDCGEILESGENIKLKELKGFEFYLKTRLASFSEAKSKDEFLNKYKRAINKLDNFYVKDELLGILSEVSGVDKSALSLKKFNINKAFISEDMRILKSIILDESFKTIILHYFSAADFIGFESDFAKFINENKISDKLNKIVLNDEIKAFDIDEFQNAVFLKAIKSTEKSIRENQKNYALLINLQERLKSLKDGLKKNLLKMA